MELHSDGPERYRLIGRPTDTSFNGDYGYGGRKPNGSVAGRRLSVGGM